MASDWWDSEPAGLRRAFGIVFHAIASQWQVHRVILGSPADSAGVLKGDILQDIGGTSGQALLAPDTLGKHVDKLDNSIDHEVTFLRNSTQKKVSMRTKLLRDMIQFEQSLGISGDDYCFSCPDCSSAAPSGAAECSDCPDNNCAVS